MASVAVGGPLVSTQWLAEHLDDPDVRVVQVDDNFAETYATAHIPGAIGLVLQSDLMTPVRRDFLGKPALEALVSRIGLHTRQTIVFYDAGGVPTPGLPAIYGYWVFRYRGAAKIAVLDGGLAKWRAEGREVTTAVPRYARGDYRLGGTDRSVRIYAGDILQHLKSGRGLKLIDVRTRAEYLGELAAPPGKPDVVIALGHIPTARHLYWEKAFTAAGTFRSKHRLARLYRKWLRPGPRIAAYCLRGERGVVTWFALHELLGQKRACLYDGSWSEWGNLVGVPVAR